MVFDLFNIAYFFFLIIFKWILPRSLLTPCFIFLGVLFIWKYSLVCLILWIGISSIIVTHYRFPEWWKDFRAT